MVSAGGGENGDGWGAVATGIAAGGAVEIPGRAAPAGGFERAAETTATGAARLGTCIGTEPRPICTDGDDAWPPVTTGLAGADIIAICVGVSDPSGNTAGMGAIPCGEAGAAAGVGIAAGSIPPKSAGSAGAAVLADPIG